MGKPKKPAPALLFTGLLFTDYDMLEKVRSALAAAFGDIAMESPTFPWNFSDYYREEMGQRIFRRFIFFRNLVGQDALADIKLRTNDIEETFAREGKRAVNIDPGYLTRAKIVLASTKDYSHRIYLRDGIFAEVTLMYGKGKFVPLVNTYRDYRDERYIRVFASARILLNLIR